MHTPSIVFAVFACGVSAVAQSVSLTAVAATPLNAQAQDTSLPFTQQVLPASVDVSSGVVVAAAVPGGVSRASTQITTTAIPPQLRIEELAVSAPFNDTFGFASTGTHDVVFTLDATRQFSGDLVVEWNGILQSLGDGALSARVDIGDDGSFEFSEVDGVFRVERFPIAFGAGESVVIRTRTTAQAFATTQSAFFGLLTVEFEPDDDSVGPGAYIPFGFGCPGSNFQSPLLLASPAGPQIGQPWNIDVTQIAPAATSVIGMIALGQVPPIHLDVIGMPFCFLSMPPLALVPRVMPPPGFGANGTVTWTVDVPDETRLLDLHFFQQVLVLDPPANAFGAVLSNPVECVIGGGW